MGGIEGLAKAIKERMKQKDDGMAKRGIIKNGMVYYGSNAYPYVQAVDCRTDEGNYVWYQKTVGGKALIVGA